MHSEPHAFTTCKTNKHCRTHCNATYKCAASGVNESFTRAITSILSVFGPVRQIKPATHQLFFFSGVRPMKCCRVDDTSPENTIVGLPPG